MAAEEREKRICDVCGQVDTAPRHIYLPDPANPLPVNQGHVSAVQAMKDLSGAERRLIVADLQDQTLQLRHMDCCAEAGCPDGSCNAIVEKAKGKQNDELVRFITNGNVDGLGEELRSGK
jgi:hypothetical protein